MLLLSVPNINPLDTLIPAATLCIKYAEVFLISERPCKQKGVGGVIRLVIGVTLFIGLLPKCSPLTPLSSSILISIRAKIKLYLTKHPAATMSVKKVRLIFQTTPVTLFYR